MLLGLEVLMIQLGLGGSQMWRAIPASVSVLHACPLPPAQNHRNNGVLLQCPSCLISREVHQPMLRNFGSRAEAKGKNFVYID